MLPAFAVELGAPNVVIASIPAVMTTGWLLPSVFVAGHTATLARRLPFVLRWTVWERVPLLGLAATAFVLAPRAPALALAALLASLFLMTLVGGLLMPAWMDVVGRLIPTELRGRFFAIWSMVGSAGALLGSAVTARILATIDAPSSYGVCFLLGAACMALSWAALTAARESATAIAAPPTPLGTYLRRLPGVLARDRNFSWFLIARALGLVAGMATAFYTVHALRAHHATGWHVGAFTALLYAGQIAGYAGLGWLGDRAGHRIVILLGMAAVVAANIVALGVERLSAYGAVFILLGLHQASGHVSNQTVVLEFAPDVEERPTYIGLGNTVVAPVALGAPLAGALVADGAGFRAVFALAALAGAGAVAVLWARVRDPRRARS